ncbi:hypothetical protein D3C72_1974250 [compost metagenome]
MKRPSSMDLIRLACTSTPGYSAFTGVARISFKPGAVVPTSTMAPLSSAGGTVPASTSDADT